MYGSGRSVQRRRPLMIIDILFHYGAIRDKVAKLS